MPTALLELIGFLMVIGGTILALRVIACFRADLVARLTGCTIDPELAALQVQRRRDRRASHDQGEGRATSATSASASPDSKVSQLFRVKTFEENVEALNRRMGRRGLNDEIRRNED